MAALVPAGFEVTAASRSKTDDFPSGVKTAIVDYSNHQQLVELFKQHDVVIEAFNPSAANLQPAIVDAAIEAKIKHLITPDFACDTFNKNAGDLLLYDVKVEAQKELEKRLKESGSDMKWTAIITGGWYDWGKSSSTVLEAGSYSRSAIPIGWFWIQPATQTVMVYGSGDQKYSISQVGTAGKATIEVLNNPEKYTNRPVYVCDYTISTNEIIPLLEEIRPGWNIVRNDIEGTLEQATKMWEDDTKNGVTDRLRTMAYALLGTAGLFNEQNKYGADHSHKAEMGFDNKGLNELKEELRVLCGTDAKYVSR